MAQILLRSSSFIFLIILGYVLKSKGFFGPKDYKLLVKILLNVTLPSAVVVSFASFQPDVSLLLGVFAGLVLNIVLLLLGMILSKGCPRESRAIWLNCVPGFNIGTFALPFIKSFLTPAGVVGACLFDIGNGLMCNGTTYSLSKNILDGTKGLNLKRIGKTLLSSTPFMTYLLMLVIVVLGISIPQVVVDFITPAANANAFLAMFMVGLMLDLRIEKTQLKQIGGILGVRFAMAVAAACVSYFLLPLPLEIRQALAISAFAPVSMASTAFAEQAGGDATIAGCVNSASILICIPCMLGLLLTFGIL